MSEWQPIETAPRKGWFDVWRDGVRFPDTRRSGRHFAAATGAWKDGQPVVERLNPPPTHWMPLPEPPSATQPQGVDGAFEAPLGAPDPSTAPGGTIEPQDPISHD